jgi:hypothetical protein
VSRAARSLFVFGIYLEFLALTLIFAPNVLLRAFHVATTHEIWIRLVGVLAGNIGVYYLLASRLGFSPIIVASVPVRFVLMVCFAGFVVFDHADPAILFFGVADVAGATWTLAALRADAGPVRAGG